MEDPKKDETAVSTNVVKQDTPAPLKPENIVLSEIIIRPVDRTPKDIQTWRTAHINAESPYYANRQRLYDLYSDVELDGHLTGIRGKRNDEVVNKNWQYVVDGAKVDAMDTFIDSQVFDDIIKEVLDSKAWGISGMEFIPGDEVTMNPIPRKHIKPDLGIIAYDQTGQTGYVYEKIQNVWVVGKRHDLGYLLKCAPYALYKRGDFADWAQYVEIFGQPVRVIKYDAYDLKTKMELKQIVDDSGSSLAIMIPKQADFEMVDGKQSNGDGQLQERLKEACNQELSVIVLGNTETTTSSKSSGYAQSKEHGKQQHQVTKSDLKFVRNQLNTKWFYRILKSYALPVSENGKFVIEKEFDLDELANRTIVDEFVSDKVPVDDDYYYETYGIPKPANYTALKAKMEAEKQLQLQQKIKPGKPVKDEENADDENETGNSTGAKDLIAESRKSQWRKLRTALADFFAQAQP